MIIVAEIGSNHCGSLRLALDHISAAARCGADAVKFQLFRADTLDSRQAVREKLKPFELPTNWLETLAEKAHESGLKFIVTPFAIDLVDPLKGLVDMVKIASGDLMYHDLIRKACKLEVPVILSTGMSSVGEISTSVWITLAQGIHQSDIYLLDCVVSYPARTSDYRLCDFMDLQMNFPEHPCGISDHTTGVVVPIAAALYKADMLEKHFKIDEPYVQMSPDAPVSMKESEFACMVACVHEAHEYKKTRNKDRPLPCEKEYFATIRRWDGKPLRG